MTPPHMKILVVEDEIILQRELVEFLDELGYDAEGVSEGQVALQRLQTETWDMLLLDIALPDISGIDILKEVALLSPDTISLVMTAFASLDTAIEALRWGAYDYLKKPMNFDELKLRIQKLRSYREITLENQALKRLVHTQEPTSSLLGESAVMQTVFSELTLLRETNANVLISGESGVGKELVARALHQQSPNKDKPFIPINISAIPESMLENQLFGHQKGAFTGAEQDQMGIFEAAQGGTVFLDEIGELPLSLQPRLLRVIEQKEIFPLGAQAPKTLTFRLLVATNRDLQQMVEEGTFRQDLYYRLNVFHIEVPPLRTRREDIPILVQHFVKEFAHTLNKPLLGFTQEAMHTLLAAEWRGNVRELRNVIERAAILAHDPWIGPALLPASLQNKPSSLRLQDVLDEAEKHHLHTVLQLTEGNKEQAAKLLGIGLTTLYRKLEKSEGSSS